MIPAPLEPELSAKIPSVEKPEGILVTKKGIIRKSDNIGSGAPIKIKVPKGEIQTVLIGR